jgi:hypothetical protein
MPPAFKELALRSQVSNNSAYFVRRESRIDGDRQIMQPDFGFAVAGSNMNVRRLAAFIGIEKCAIGAPS